MQKDASSLKRRSTMSLKLAENVEETKRNKGKEGPKIMKAAGAIQTDKKPSFKVPKDDGKFRSEFVERQWLMKHDREWCIDFKEEDRKKLREYFQSLDSDGSGSIGVEELEDPLIALGLAQSRDEVQKLFSIVDENGSGSIDFEEFLALMSTIKNNQETKDAPIFAFFNGMLEGALPEGMDKGIPFQLNVSQYRRKRILDAIMGGEEKKASGEKIMNAFKTQLYAMKQREKAERGDNPNDVSLDEAPNREEANIRTGFEIKKVLGNSVRKNNNKLIKPKSIPIKSPRNVNK